MAHDKVTPRIKTKTRVLIEPSSFFLELEIDMNNICAASKHNIITMVARKPLIE